MMTEGNKCIYIAAVLTLTVIHIHGHNVSEKCINKGFTLVDGECYKLNMDEVSWTAARDNCNNWNGRLATNTSLKHMRRVDTALVSANGSNYYWINGPNEPNEKEIQWAFADFGDVGHFALFTESCKSEFKSFCIEANNDQRKIKLDVRSTTNQERVGVMDTQKVTCLRNDSVLVDGHCYRSTPTKLTSSQAELYCADQNETLATISSFEQGIKVIESLDLIGVKLWVKTQFQNYTGNFVILFSERQCQLYEFGNLSDKISLRALCMKFQSTELTTTPKSAFKTESTTALESTTTQKLTTTSDRTTTQESTSKRQAYNGAESTTTPSPTPGLTTSPSPTPGLTTTPDLTRKKVGPTIPIGQNSEVKENRLHNIFRLMTKVRYETRIDFNIRKDY